MELHKEHGPPAGHAICSWVFRPWQPQWPPGAALLLLELEIGTSCPLVATRGQRHLSTGLRGRWMG